MRYFINMSLRIMFVCVTTAWTVYGEWTERVQPCLAGYSRGQSQIHLSFAPLRGAFAFTGGISLPLGEFGDSEHATSVKEGDAGFASLGFSLTLRGFLEFGSLPLGWTFDGSLIMNSVDEDEFENAVRSQFSLSNEYELNVNPSMWWITVPLLTGPTIKFSPLPAFGLNAAGLVGLAIVRPADVTVSGDNAETEYNYELVSAFCGGWESGVDISQFLIMGRFIFSRLHDVDGDENISIFGFSGSDAYEKDFSMVILQLSLGYRF